MPHYPKPLPALLLLLLPLLLATLLILLFLGPLRDPSPAAPPGAAVGTPPSLTHKRYVLRIPSNEGFGFQLLYILAALEEVNNTEHGVLVVPPFIAPVRHHPDVVRTIFWDDLLALDAMFRARFNAPLNSVRLSRTLIASLALDCRAHIDRECIWCQHGTHEVAALLGLPLERTVGPLQSVCHTVEDRAFDEAPSCCQSESGACCWPLRLAPRFRAAGETALRALSFAGTEFVGVHLRRTDRCHWKNPLFAAWQHVCNLTLADLGKLVAPLGIPRVFLSTDDPAFQQAANGQTVAGVTFFSMASLPSDVRGAMNSLESGLAELHLLAHSDAFVATHAGSRWAQLAAENKRRGTRVFQLRRQPLELAECARCTGPAVWMQQWPDDTEPFCCPSHDDEPRLAQEWW